MYPTQDGARRVADLIGAADPSARSALRLVERGGVPLIEVAVPGPFRLLLTTRFGGTSSRGYSELNLSYWVGDDPEAVDRNHVLLARALGFSQKSMVLPWQVHGVDVLELDECRRRGERVPCDGLVVRSSRDRGLAALMLSGDCLTIVLMGEETCSLIHAGWRGLVDGIVEQGVEAMGEDAPRWVFFAPAIGPCCYEVGDEVVSAVRTSFQEAEDLLPRNGSNGSNGSHRRHFDLWSANRRWLREAGVRQIEVAEICTACHMAEFFSYRGSQGKTGHFGALMMLQA